MLRKLYEYGVVHAIKYNTVYGKSTPLHQMLVNFIQFNLLLLMKLLF